MTVDSYPREKHWKLIYLRSNKIHRAKQLGFQYPRKGESRLIEEESINLLFVCSLNRRRSRTAEKIYNDRNLVYAKSAGIQTGASNIISPPLIKWAEVVLVMEDKHRDQLLTQFPEELCSTELEVLGIPDEFRYMDSELVKKLTSLVDPILKIVA